MTTTPKSVLLTCSPIFGNKPAFESKSWAQRVNITTLGRLANPAVQVLLRQPTEVDLLASLLCHVNVPSGRLGFDFLGHFRRFLVHGLGYLFVVDLRRVEIFVVGRHASRELLVCFELVPLMWKGRGAVQRQAGFCLHVRPATGLLHDSPEG